MPHLYDRFTACILGGAIGDAWGSGYENQPKEADDVISPFGKPEAPTPVWQITDDTQLTLATIEALIEDTLANPQTIADSFLRAYQNKQLSGLGSSTLKALRELAVGGHWSQVGRRGEYAAGNGAAMRIAPLAFCKNITSSQLRDICSITHHNDEAYVGALAVFKAIQATIKGDWNGSNNLIECIIDQLPDTRVRDRLLEIRDMDSLRSVGQLGNGGYVVDSVPLALAAANQVKKLGFEEMLQTLIAIGGDTDTNCSIAGQVAGCLLGVQGIPAPLLAQLETVRQYDWIQVTIEAWVKKNDPPPA